MSSFMKTINFFNKSLYKIRMKGMKYLTFLAAIQNLVFAIHTSSSTFKIKTWFTGVADCQFRKSTCCWVSMGCGRCWVSLWMTRWCRHLWRVQSRYNHLMRTPHCYRHLFFLSLLWICCTWNWKWGIVINCWNPLIKVFKIQNYGWTDLLTSSYILSYPGQFCTHVPSPWVIVKLLCLL